MIAGMNRLSVSSQAALRFAWAAAQEREDRPPPSAEVNPWDLLVGMVLAHPGTSEAELTFRHCGLVVGQALPSDYPQLTQEALNEHLAETPVTVDPPLNDEADAIVTRAVERRRPDPPSTVTELAWLWWAFLTAGTPESNRVQRLLQENGIRDVSTFASTMEQWLASNAGESESSAGDSKEAQATKEAPESFERFLLRAAPDTTRLPVDVINYMADQTFSPDPSRPTAAPDDFIGISAEVDAFAYLLASRSLNPPLAVGLFGDWGSGKSYFLDGIRRRIDQLTTSDAVTAKAQRDTPFWKRIVHVEFNAWHYVEGDLWSSLVDHIITQLSLASDGLDDSLLTRRQEYYLTQLETTSTALKALQGQKKSAEDEEIARREELDRLQTERDDAVAALRAAENQRVVENVVSDSTKKLIDAVGAIQLDGGAGNTIRLREASDQLGAARAELSRGRALLSPFLQDKRWQWYLFLGIVALVVVPLAIDWLSGSAAGAAFGGLASFIVTALAALGAASRWVRGQLDTVEKARLAVNREIADEEARWSDRLRAARAEVEASSRKLEEIRQREAELQAQVHVIDEQLGKQPTEILYEFLKERFTNDYYRQRLGVPAIVRRDFRGLAELIHHQNAYLVAPPEQREEIKKQAEGENLNLLEPHDDRIINRIILYIDDLDRCPDGKVIEVLQAVHMLLAFPLFVVVVAVDSRWLAHALQSRFPALVDSVLANGDAVARPDDYLEKIFQVPFWVRPLDDDSRGRIVRGLLGRHVRRVPVDRVDAGPEARFVEEREAQTLREMIEPRIGPPQLDAAALTISPKELAFLDSLGPLMGDTPRAVKRFVNVYQLIKIVLRGRAADVAESPSDEHVAACLLAIAEGLPNLGSRIFERAETATWPETLGSVIDSLTPEVCDSELKRLNDWLADRYEWRSVTMDRVAVLAAEVRRFVFGVTSRSGSAMGVDRPQLVHIVHDNWGGRR